MKPPGWRESVTGESTSFRFHTASNFRRIALTILLTPLSLLAFSMTAASIREANWGLGYACVAGFDLVAACMLLVVVQQYNRTRIVLESGHLTWDDGPLLRTRERMTYEEAATLGATIHTSRGSTQWFTFSFTRNLAAKSLGTSMNDNASVQFVLGRIADEIQRRTG